MREKAVARVATRKYLMVLGLIFAASLVTFTVFEELLQSQVSHQVLNNSGRQRMLTQRIALYVSLLRNPDYASSREEIRTDLVEAIADLKRTQESLIAQEENVFGFGAIFGVDVRYRAELQRLDYSLFSFTEDASRLIDPEAGLSEREFTELSAHLIESARTKVLEDMERFVSVYEMIGRERADLLHSFAIVGETFTILLLVLSGVGVFRPLVRDIETRMKEQRRIETYYRAILDNVGDGVVAFDRRMNIRYGNATFAAQHGCPVDELPGRSLAEFLPEISGMKDVFSRRIRRMEVEQVTPEKGRRHYDVSLYIFEFGGDLQCIVSLRDITERKDLENRLRLFFYGIEHSPLSIVITDTSGTIQYANHMTTVTSGFAVDEILGANPRIFKSGEMAAEVYQAMWANLMAGKSWYGELLNRRKNGELYWEYEAISALKNEKGEITHFMAIKEDITEKKAAGAALEKAKLQAEAANRAKSEFLANMSHELRTPLNAIIGFAEVMDMELFGPHQVPQYKEYSHSIFDSATHLLGIINEILDYSKIEANKVVLYEEFASLGEILDSIYTLNIKQAEKKGVDLTLGPHVEATRQLTVHVDVLRIKQVLLNIVSNAVKFTPKAGSVVIDSRLRPDGALEILVKDTGIGMKPEDVPRALERFSQVDATLARRYEGTGLGLPIAKTLVEPHGGTLTLASVENKGTTAIVVLPARRVSFDPSAVPVLTDG